MRMTTKGRYALRAAIALAKMSDGKTPISIKTISEAEEISSEFLEQIFFKLRKAGLITSVRGPGGGFYFARALSEISLKDIVEASGEGMEIAACAFGAEGACDRTADCAAGTVWRELSTHIDSFLSGITLEGMLSRKVHRG
ncbi:MAG: Rrf2 family transcriptional regulator [Spirochaetae bacterium HGW-Spirochaetae-3]|jgi:Rrf2 family iron-sulfur cluster assembly transcriptional regulator|nr:MAG: Rrf2 family transcriptional regulator [Spirochaetae bacterium HGW-Spirochaetae-3]